MKYKAIYDAESDIPAEVKDFYHLVKGKWEFNYGDFDGLAGLSNPGLDSKKNEIRDKLEEEKRKTTDLQTKLTDAENKIKEIEKPGTVAISESEKKELDDWRDLGAFKDVKEKLEKGEEAIGKVASYETEREIRQLAKDTGVDADALVDFKLHNERGKDVELSKEKKKVKIGKNKEEERFVLVAVKTDTVNGEDKKTNVDFSEFAKEKNFPDYLVRAIFTEPVEESKKGTKRTEFKLPSTTTEKADNDTSKSSAAEKKGEERKFRNDRKLPWMRKDKED